MTPETHPCSRCGTWHEWGTPCAGGPAAYVLDWIAYVERWALILQRTSHRSEQLLFAAWREHRDTTAPRLRYCIRRRRKYQFLDF